MSKRGAGQASALKSHDQLISSCSRTLVDDPAQVGHGAPLVLHGSGACKGRRLGPRAAAAQAGGSIVSRDQALSILRVRPSRCIPTLLPSWHTLTHRALRPVAQHAGGRRVPCCPAPPCTWRRPPELWQLEQLRKRVPEVGIVLGGVELRWSSQTAACGRQRRRGAGAAAGSGGGGRWPPPSPRPCGTAGRSCPAPTLGTGSWCRRYRPPARRVGPAPALLLRCSPLLLSGACRAAGGWRSGRVRCRGAVRLQLLRSGGGGRGAGWGRSQGSSRLLQQHGRPS